MASLVGEAMVESMRSGGAFVPVHYRSMASAGFNALVPYPGIPDTAPACSLTRT
ncbi:hypothetical protein JOF46_004215 [Paeniglutamicibacter psychrophenolicus]|uniref:Uncharacterized protein n=1 Tax=Paeniglutamicibacter psychrophenolicus TaxID=257454 RepID=A0ABS4WJC5_9MICC|nr:hypothetical protein [Paeniglutamicibacter psychrophenolicus]